MSERLSNYPVQEHKERLAVRPLSQNELLQITQVDSRDRGLQTRVNTYMCKNGSGVRIGGANVLFLAHENEKNENSLVPQPLRELIADPRVAVVNMEYLIQELDQKTKAIPVVGKLLHKVWSSDRTPYYSKHTAKGEFAQNLAEVCRINGKTIAVSDLANGPAFEASLHGEGALYFGSAATVFHKAGVPSELSTDLGFLLGFGSMWFLRLAEHFDDGRGIKIYEKFIPDVEDARRIQVAAGLGVLAEEYQNPLAGLVDAPQIVVPYPLFHIDRIEHYLMPQTKTDRVTRNAKQVLYRAALPHLDSSIRQYRWDDSRARLIGDESSADWHRFSNRPIPRIK